MERNMVFKQLLAENKLTPEKLAQKLPHDNGKYYSKQGIYNWVNGDTKPTVRTCEKLSKMLKHNGKPVDPVWLRKILYDFWLAKGGSKKRRARKSGNR